MTSIVTVPKPRFLEPDEIFIGKVVNAAFVIQSRYDVAKFNLLGSKIEMGPNNEPRTVDDAVHIIYVIGRDGISQEAQQNAVVEIIELVCPMHAFQGDLSVLVHLDFEVTCTKRVSKTGREYRRYSWARYHENATAHF